MKTLHSSDMNYAANLAQQYTKDESNQVANLVNEIHQEQTKTILEHALHEALATFDSHGLQDLNTANLMNRVDSKFLLLLSFLPDLLLQLNSYYSVLEIDEKTKEFSDCETFINKQMRTSTNNLAVNQQGGSNVLHLPMKLKQSA